MNSPATNSIGELLAQVRTEYLRRLSAGEGLLRQVEAHLASTHGKMLRPRLTLLAADTVGQAHCRRTILAATCVEMLHNASLLHDDIIDHAGQRRGLETVNARWGNGVAVLVGDYHLAQIMTLLDEIDDREASRKINLTVIDMVKSELLQKEIALGQQPLSQENYLRIIDGKTARLFATACALGNPDYEDFGLHYGRLFQLRDDLADGEANTYTTRLIAAEEETLSHMPCLDIQ